MSPKKPVLTFDPETHVYTLDGVKLPSVTELLAPFSDFSAVPADVLERAREFGIAVHDMARLYFDDRLDEGSLDEPLLGCLAALKRWLADYSPFEREQPGGLLVDIKSRDFDAAKDSLQLSGYNLLWQGAGQPPGIHIEQPFGSAKHRLAGTPDILIATPGVLTITNRWILSLYQDGSYKYHNARRPQDDAMFRFILDRHHRENDFQKKIQQWGKTK